MGKVAGALLLTVLSPLLLALLILAAPLIALGLAYDRWQRAKLRRAFTARWWHSGKDVLLVYSDIPHWKDYVEAHWLPRLQSRAVVLNWSQRATWGDRHPPRGGHSGGQFGIISMVKTALCEPRSSSWSKRSTFPGFHITWSTSAADLSPDGQLAYLVSTNTVTLPGPEGQPVSTNGRAVTVWRRESDGNWRCAVDIWNDGPSPG